MKLKTETINAIKGLNRPFSLEGAARATGKHYLTIRKYVNALGEEIKLVEMKHDGKRGRPTPIYGFKRVNGKFASYKGKEPIL